VKIGTSEFGTNAKCRPALKLSAYRGGSEVIGARSERRDWPFADVAGSIKFLRPSDDV